MLYEQKNESELLAEIKSGFAENNSILADQLGLFTKAVAPYMLAVEDISGLVKADSAFEGMYFFQLKSCTVEEQDDIFQFINMRIEKLLTAVFPLKTPVLYGVISRNGQANIVFGVSYDKKDVVKSIINGLLTGIDIEEKPSCTFADVSKKGCYGGLFSAVPILEVEKEKQQFDISALMKSLNGKDYNVLVYAMPRYDGKELYTTVLNVKDNAYSISKRNFSMQKSVNDSKTVTETVTTNKRGVIQELANQVVRERKINFGALVDSFIDGGIKSKSEAVSEATTIEGLSRSESFDIQNSMALELIDYCDKAIERIKHGLSVGVWDCAITYSASDKTDAEVLKSCLYAELGKPADDVIPLVHYDYSDKEKSIFLPSKASQNNPLFVPVTSQELGMLCTPPTDPVPDFEIRYGKLYPLIPAKDGVLLGKITDGQRAFDNMPFSLSEKDLNKHTFVCGITGSGKTTTVKTILRGANKPYLVIEAAKKEYRSLEGVDEVFTLGKPEVNCIQMNPFYVQCGINLQEHIDFLKDLFNASFSFYGPMPYILEKCLGNIYKKRGWNLTLGYHPLLVKLKDKLNIFDAAYMQKQYSMAASDYLFPTMYDLKEEVKRYIEEMQYEGEVKGNIKSAILSRLESLCVGSKGFMFNTNNHLDIKDLMSKKTVFELEGLADDSDKAFCVGLLVIFIKEYRQVWKELDRSEGLKHLLVIEEAHRLLKNVDTEKSSENMGNPKGKAVEHFTNMLAEMRSYGQGVIIAEQIPLKLAPDVIKNSSNKIVQRIVSADDQRLIANTIGIKVQDSVYLGNMKTGFALCHKEGMSLPVSVKIDGKRDGRISDDDVRAMAKKDMELTFAAINKQLITESMEDTLKVISFRLLNTLLVMDENDVSRDIRRCRDMISAEVGRKDICLLPMTRDRREKLYGAILTERLVSRLNNGIYEIGCLVPDSLMTEIEEMAARGISAMVTPVKKRLSALYKRDCRMQCYDAVCTLMKSQYSAEMNLEQTARSYFFLVSDNIVDEICKKVKEVTANA